MTYALDVSNLNYTEAHEIALAAAKDAANASARRAGRARWNKYDYHQAVKVFNRLLPDDLAMDLLQQDSAI